MGKGKRRRAAGRTHPPALRLRADRRDAALPWPTRPVPWHTDAVWLDDPTVRPGISLQYAAGDFYIQDAGSLLAIAACGDVRGLRVCDLCAAPGGKATALAERIGAEGCLLANEPIRSRLGPLRHNLARTGTDRWAISSRDPDELVAPFAGFFDLVLVDAPCSGQALVGRGRQSAASFTDRQVEHSAARQRRILAAAVQLVRPGGRLVYSTCTFAEAENEAQVAWLLKYDLGFAVETIDALLPYASPLHPGCYRLQPPQHQTDGAFAVALRRAVTASQAEPAQEKSVDGDSLPEEIAQWARLDDWIVKAKEHICFAWPVSMPNVLVAHADFGPEFCFRTRQTWKPAHGLALLQHPTAAYQPKQTIELSDEAARHYLSGQTIPDPHRGWGIVTWEGKPLGWVKGDGKQLKNHLPSSARFTLPAN